MDLEGIIRYLERKFREAQKNEKKFTKVSVMDLAWALDTLETMKRKMENE